MTKLPLVDSGFAIPVFFLGDDPIACLNKAMAFLIAVASSSTTSSGRHGQSYSSTGYKSNANCSGGNNSGRQARVVKCYNCQGEGHMARQWSQPKRPRNATWCKEKAMLAEAQKAGQILDEEQLTEDLDTYDSDCDDISNAKAVLMANISNYGYDVISEFDSIKKTHVRTKEHSDSLIDKLNLKSAENDDLKAKIQDKVFVITSLKNDLRRIKGIEIVDIAAQKPSANTIIPGMFKLDLEPLAHRITSANVVPPKKTTSHSVKTQKPELKVYDRKPKNVKNTGSSKKAKIVESKNANHSEPNHSWGSNATDIPSSSSLIMKGCLDCSLAFGLRMFKTYDKEPLTAHELSFALGKSKKSSDQPKAEDTNQEKLYLLHMDLCGPMRVASINGKRDDWDHLFQPMFDEYFSPPSIVVSLVPVAAAPRAVDLADSPVSTSIDQDTPSASIPSTQDQKYSPTISQGTLKFVSKTEDYQKYGALIPDEMINDDIKLSTAYKTYLDYATEKVPPKKARKFKKPASPKLKTIPGDSKDESDDVHDEDDNDDDDGNDDGSGNDDGGDEEYVHTPEKDKSDDEEKMCEEEDDDVAKELYGDLYITHELRDTDMINAEQGRADQQNASNESGFMHKEEDAYPKSSSKSTQGEELGFKAVDTEMQQDQGNESGHINDQPDKEAAPTHDWFQKHDKPPTPDRPWKKSKYVNFRPPQKWISTIAKARQPPRTRIVILHRVKDLQLGVESYQKKLNITRPETFRLDIPNMIPYTAYKNPQGIIYQDKFQRNRLMCSDEIYKFYDGTLSSVRTVLHDIASSLEMDCLLKRH
nr:hypothetical protein [Tanacetum cinerariifolium]